MLALMTSHITHSKFNIHVMCIWKESNKMLKITETEETVLGQS